MSARRAVTDLIVGGPPRVDLLPPEVRERERGRAAAGGAAFAILIAVGIVGAGYAVGTVLNLTAQTHLDSASNHTQQLLKEQEEFAEVQQIKGQLGLAGTAQRVGAASMTDWGGLVGRVAAVLPGTVQSIRGDVASPLEGFPQSAIPLQGTRVGALQVTVRTATLPDVSAWLDSLAALDFVVDVVPGTISVQEDGSYLTDLIINFNEEAIKNPFVPEETDESEESEESAESDESTTGESSSQEGNNS